MGTGTARRLGLTAAALTSAGVLIGCGSTARPCVPGKLVVTFHLDDVTRSADTIEVEVTMEGVTTVLTSPHSPGTSDGTIEIDFPDGYPAGSRIDVTLIAMQSISALGARTGTVSALAAKCDALAIDVPLGGTCGYFTRTLQQAPPDDGGSGASCVYDLGDPPSNDTTNSVIDVFGDDNRIPHDVTQVDGWDYEDATHSQITIFGPTCDAVIAGTIKHVNITYDCLQN
jgi:hypothetical protein